MGILQSGHSKRGVYIFVFLDSSRCGGDSSYFQFFRFLVEGVSLLISEAFGGRELRDSKLFF